MIADSDLYVELHSVLKSLVAPDLSSFSFTFQPFGATAVMRGKAHVGNSLGIAPVSQSCRPTIILPLNSSFYNCSVR